jgi:hypothetical protein
MIRCEWILALAIIVPCTAIAQETITAPKGVTTQKITRAALDDPMIDTDGDGRLLIDWEMTERLALTPADPRRAALARLMLAIRDGQWKAMPVQR